MHEFFTVGRNEEIFKKVFVNIMLIVGVLCAAFKLHDKNSNCQRKGLFEQPGDLTPPQLYIDESKEISRKEGSCP